MVSKGPRASRGKDTSSAAVPAPLSIIIMKLPAQNAKERYQSASGLKPILGRCLTQRESHGRIDAFPLGAHDASHPLRFVRSSLRIC